MPIYEYRCRRCRHSFEHIVLSKTERVRCPKCASNGVEKQLSVFSPMGTRTEPGVSRAGCGCTPQTCGCH